MFPRLVMSPFIAKRFRIESTKAKQEESSGAALRRYPDVAVSAIAASGFLTCMENENMTSDDPFAELDLDGASVDDIAEEIAQISEIDKNVKPVGGSVFVFDLETVPDESRFPRPEMVEKVRRPDRDDISIVKLAGLTVPSIKAIIPTLSAYRYAHPRPRVAVCSGDGKRSHSELLMKQPCSSRAHRRKLRSKPGINTMEDRT